MKNRCKSSHFSGKNGEKQKKYHKIEIFFSKSFGDIKIICTFAPSNKTDRADSLNHLNKIKAMITYNGLNYTTSEVNRDYKMKAYGYFNGKKVNTLIGVAGLVAMVGIDNANKMIARAMASRKDKETCKLRRGIQVTFYYC